MGRISFIAAPTIAGIESFIVLCCPADAWCGAALVTAWAVPDSGPFFWPLESLDDAALMAVVQFFLRTKKAQLPVSEDLQQVWNLFYRRHCRVVQDSIATAARRPLSTAEREDIRQEVWHEILLRLPKLKHQHIEKGVGSWLAGFARRKVRRLMSRSSSARGVKSCASLDDLKERLPSRDLGPEEACRFRETWDQLNLALSKLRERTSPKHCEIFFRRFFWHQSAKEIAAALDLTPKAVRHRYSRLKRLWQRLTAELALPWQLSAAGESAASRRGNFRLFIADFPASGDNF